MPYTPKPPPRTKPEFQELYDYLEQELQSISRELLGTTELELRTTYKEPARPREGMIVQADGTTWDPGEGAGTYKYEAGVWKRFGDADHTHVLADVTDAGALAALDEVALTDMADMATDRVIGRDTAGTGVPEELTLSQVLDFVGSAARGDVLVRGASTWARLAVGAADTFLTSNGTDPSWAVLPNTGWESLQENSPTSGSSTDFTDIDQSHKILLFLARRIDMSSAGITNLRVGTTSGFGTLVNVDWGALGATGTTATARSPIDDTEIAIAPHDTTATTNWFVVIFDYSSTTRYKVGMAFGGRTNSTSSMYCTFFTIETTAAIEHLRFISSAGSYVSGTIEMIGLL